jgi:hypothetical protein
VVDRAAVLVRGLLWLLATSRWRALEEVGQPRPSVSRVLHVKQELAPASHCPRGAAAAAMSEKVAAPVENGTLSGPGEEEHRLLEHRGCQGHPLAFERMFE